MKQILLIFLFSLALNFGFSQCPDSIKVNGNSKCLNVFWAASRPTPYPDSITIGTTSYSLDPVGSTANPSSYNNESS